MNYKVTKAPLNAPVKIGQILSLEEVAQLLESNAAQILARSQLAAQMGHSGYWFAILQDGEAT